MKSGGRCWRRRGNLWSRARAITDALLAWGLPGWPRKSFFRFWISCAMPDFEKALKQLRGPKPATPGPKPLRARLSAALRFRSFSLTEQLQFLKSKLPSAASDVLPSGEVQCNALGSHFLVR